MKEVRILTLDARGRVVIPQIVRKSLGLQANSQLMMVADSANKQIKLTPVGLTVKDPIQYVIKMGDSAGALGKLATLFGKLGISLIYGEALTLEKDKVAIWTVIGPRPDNISLEKLKEILLKEGEALDVDCKPLE